MRWLIFNWKNYSIYMFKKRPWPVIGIIIIILWSLLLDLHRSLHLHPLLVQQTIIYNVRIHRTGNPLCRLLSIMLERLPQHTDHCTVNRKVSGVLLPSILDSSHRMMNYPVHLRDNIYRGACLEMIQKWPNSYYKSTIG